MKIEVYKLYDDNIKLLDTVSTPQLTYKSRYFPPDGKFNSNSVSNGSPVGELKFDSKGSEYDFGSTLRNVVLDYAGPEFVTDHSKYTSYKENSQVSFNIKFEITDYLGVDCEKFQIGFFYGTNNERIIFDSRHTFEKNAEYNNLPTGDLNYDTQFNYDYNGPAKELVDEIGSDFIDYTNSWYIYRIGKQEKYMVDFNINITGDSNSGALGLLYKDLDAGKYQKYIEFNAGNLFVKLWDLAGNEYVFTGFKPLIVVPWSCEDFVKMLDPLTLYFYDTYPANMFIQENVIGQSNILVENNNDVISRKYGLLPILKLEDDSLGYLVDTSKKYEDHNLYQEVDGIDSVGYVKAFAFLYSDIFDVEAISLIREATYVKGSLGPWVKECVDNTRKINVDPFVPEFAKDTKFYHFCKFLENFLNTAWCPLDKDCRIGLLEKISRIGNFNDIDKIEHPAIQYWAEDRGNELAFDITAIDAIKGMSKKYNLLDMDNFQCVRYLYKNLPYINLYKGTIDCFNIVFNSLGINAELIPLWGLNLGDEVTVWEPEYYYDSNKNSSANWNKHINDLYYLSSHIELKIHGYLAYDLVNIASSLVKLAKSILPVTRVIEYLLIEEYSISSNILSLGYFNNSQSVKDSENTLQCISLLWKCKDCECRTVTKDYIEIRIPQIAEKCCTNGKNWWKGYNNKTGSIYDSVIRGGITISNNRTLNASKFFNMMNKTLENHKLYIYVDYSDTANNIALNDSDWYKQLIPLGNNKIDAVSIKWDSGFFVIRAKMNSLNSIAQLNTAKYITFTFVFNRNTGLCYTIDLKTALKDIIGTSLPGYKPYEWTKYRHERI